MTTEDMNAGEPQAYTGQEIATVDRLVRYLRDNYGNADGSALEEEQLLDLVVKHVSLIRTGIALASHAFYPGDQLAMAEGLNYIGPDDDA